MSTRSAARGAGLSLIHICRLVGRKGKALGMNVVAYDPFIADGAVFEADGVKKVASVEELYRVSDFLSLHIPATAQTKGSIGYDLMMSWTPASPNLRWRPFANHPASYAVASLASVFCVVPKRHDCVAATAWR